MDNERIANGIKGLENAEIRLRQAVDRGGEMAVMGAFNSLNEVSNALSVIRELKAENERMNELLKEQEQLKIALSEGQKQVQSLLSSGRELEETINILKGEIERLKQEKADAVKRIERCRQNCISGEKDCDSAYNKNGKVWYRAKADAYKQALDIINTPSI